MQLTIDLTTLDTELGLKAGRCAAVALLSALPDDEASLAINEWHAVLEARGRAAEEWPIKPSEGWVAAAQTVREEVAAVLKPATREVLADAKPEPQPTFEKDDIVARLDDARIGQIETFLDREDGPCAIVMSLDGGRGVVKLASLRKATPEEMIIWYEAAADEAEGPHLGLGSWVKTPAGRLGQVVDMPVDGDEVSYIVECEGIKLPFERDQLTPSETLLDELAEEPETPALKVAEEAAEEPEIKLPYGGKEFSSRRRGPTAALNRAVTDIVCATTPDELNALGLPIANLGKAFDRIGRADLVEQLTSAYAKQRGMLANVGGVAGSPVPELQPEPQPEPRTEPEEPPAPQPVPPPEPEPVQKPNGQASGLAALERLSLKELGMEAMRQLGREPALVLLRKCQVMGKFDELSPQVEAKARAELIAAIVGLGHG